MKTTQLNSGQPRRMFRRVLILSVFALLGLGSMINYSGCLPIPTMFQISGVVSCGSVDITKPISSGTLDVSLANGYVITIGLQNMLVQTANPTLFKPETNTIQVTEAKVWFEYPAQFSLLGAGAELYTKANPKITKLFFTSKPKTSVNFSGRGTSGATVVQSDILSFSLVPSETTAKWSTASELKSAQLGSKFAVIAHLTISGTTTTGSIMQTQELEFPLNICLGCFNVATAAPGAVLTCSKVLEIGAAGSSCGGQDGVCLKKKTK